jgi:ABC-type Fe3+/spermidine/putrescine transport system ATPase subunit
MSRIQIHDLSKSYGPTLVVDDFELDIEQGELVVFLGPSGCGKTTTLRMIAGFIAPSKGRILVGERDITNVPTYDRNIGVVFQNYALFPHLSVFENIAFGLRRRKLADAAIRRKVVRALEMVAMGHLANRMPRELSGGQQQRVAIGRAVVIEPDVLLLDEPLSNLDAKLRLNIRQEIRRLQKSLGITTILVTHDQEEAMSIADRLVVMKDGRIQQIGHPQKIYAEPANSFVADFIGGANFLTGRVVDNAFQTSSGLVLAATNLSSDCRSVVIRPERIKIASREAGLGNSVAAMIANETFLGSGRLLDVRLATGDSLSVYVGAGEDVQPPQGQEEIVLHISAKDVLGIRDEAAPGMGA